MRRQLRNVLLPDGYGVGDPSGRRDPLIAGGAGLVGADRNVRLRAPDGIQLTLFTVLADAPA